jgi:hypothetical protein
MLRILELAQLCLQYLVIWKAATLQFCPPQPPKKNLHINFLFMHSFATTYRKIEKCFSCRQLEATVACSSVMGPHLQLFLFRYLLFTSLAGSVAMSNSRPATRYVTYIKIPFYRTQYTHHSLKHMLPQHCKTYNDVFLLINSTKV